MEEVTTWNNHPRWMWVWDDVENGKRKEYVVCILTKKEMFNGGTDCPIITVHSEYMHCAEIEETPKKETPKKETRLTYYELSQLLKCIGIEVSDYSGRSVYNEWTYSIEKENEEILVNYKIRYRQGEWEKPTRETVWKWWGDETPGSDIAKFISFLGWNEE